MHGVVEHSTTSIYTPPKRAASAAALPEVTAITTDAELPKLLCSGRPHGSDPNECQPPKSVTGKSSLVICFGSMRSKIAGRLHWPRRAVIAAQKSPGSTALIPG